MRREESESERECVSLANLCCMHNNQEAQEKENEKRAFHMLAQTTSKCEMGHQSQHIICVTRCKTQTLIYVHTPAKKRREHKHTDNVLTKTKLSSLTLGEVAQEGHT